MLGVYGPEIERAAAAGLTGDMAPPGRVTIHHRNVAADVAAFQQRHTHMTGAIAAVVFVRRPDGATVDAHALEIDDGLGEHREARRHDAVRTRLETLAEGDGKLVVDPALARIPCPRVEILGRNIEVGRTIDVAKIL